MTQVYDAYDNVKYKSEYTCYSTGSSRIIVQGNGNNSPLFKAFSSKEHDGCIFNTTKKDKYSD